METIVANAGPARRVTDADGTWLVAPATLIVPGVLDGSQGPLYYPPDEVARNVDMWHGMPLTRNHPANGAPARNVLKDVGLGVVRNPAIVNGELRAEAWFHEGKTRRVDQDIWNALIRGEPIELSTGLGTTNENVSGEDSGRRYVAVARNYSPDHVAVLTDGQVGACSLDDGCGVNNAKGIVEKFWDWLQNAGKYNNPQSRVTGRFKMKNAGTGVGEVHEAAQAGGLLFTDRDRELGEVAKAASAILDESIWDRAKEAAGKTYDESDDAYWSACAAIYTRMGGEIRTTESDTMNRDETIKYLVTNCDCWKGKEKILANKEMFSDEDLKKLKTNIERDRQREEIVAAVTEGFGSENVVANVKRAAKVLNAVDPEEDEEDDEEEEEDAYNMDEEDEELTEEEKEEKKKKMPPFLAKKLNKNKTRNRRRKPQTTEQWLAAAPPEARETLSGLIANDKRARVELVGRLVANAKPDAKERLTKHFMSMPTEVLRDLAASPSIVANDKREDPLLDYFGAGGGPSTVNAGTDAVESVDYDGEWPPSLPIKTKSA